MKKLVFLFVLFSSASFSQVVKKFTLHFNFSDSELNETHEKKIDSVLSTLSNKAFTYKVEINGHADSAGGKALNVALSAKRAKETAEYFYKKGFAKQKVQHAGKGFSKPLCESTTDAGKQKNRRAEITISLDLPVIKNVGGLTLKTERFKTNSDSVQEIKTASGTRIVIPANAYRDENGRIVKGPVEIVYTEFRNTVDFILGGINMNYYAGGKEYFFSSGGMFRVQPYKNGKRLYLREGENVQVDFVMERQLADANFYELDSDSGHWRELQKLTDASGNIIANSSSQNIPICGGSRTGERICHLSDCKALLFMVKAGMQYASGTESLYNMNSTSDSLSRVISSDQSGILQQQKKFTQSADSARSAIFSYKHQFKLKKTKSSKAKTNFVLTCENNPHTELLEFKDAEWEYREKDNAGVSNSLFRKMWDSCSISFEGNLFSMTLSDSAEAVSLEKLKLITKKRISRQQKPSYFQSLINGFEKGERDLKAKIQGLVSRENLQRQQARQMQFRLDSLIRIKKQNDSIMKQMKSDSLYCLWSISKGFAQLKAGNMKYESWLQYFDAHKSEMRKYYEEIKLREDWKECDKERKIREEAKKRLEFARKNQNQSENAMKFLSMQLNISGTNFYNVDKLAQLKQRVLIKAEYRDEQGRTVEPMFIYIIDSNINGMLRYDGVMEYSPYYFGYDPGSENTLIAFDKDMNAWIFPKERFKEINAADGKARHTFTLKKLKDLKNKEELKKLL